VIEIFSRRWDEVRRPAPSAARNAFASKRRAATRKNVDPSLDPLNLNDSRRTLSMSSTAVTFRRVLEPY